MNRNIKRRSILLAAGLAFAGVIGLGQREASAIFVRTGAVYRPRPVARAVVATTAVVATAVVVGSVVRSLPPSCSTVMVGDVAYEQCGSSWYQPRYAGSQVTYVVVNPPH
jgi:hypothetical protein